MYDQASSPVGNLRVYNPWKKEIQIQSSEVNHTNTYDKTNKMTCAPIEDSDLPGHPPSLISLRCVLNG